MTHSTPLSRGVTVLCWGYVCLALLVAGEPATLVGRPPGLLSFSRYNATSADLDWQEGADDGASEDPVAAVAVEWLRLSPIVDACALSAELDMMGEDVPSPAPADLPLSGENSGGMAFWRAVQAGGLSATLPSPPHPF
jgi:hypothetical protein